jgi:AcrR family transcriptional regulator
MAQVKKPAVREAIFEAARMLFRDQGYNGTTLTQIAVEAGISTANLYSYFNSKFDILYSVYDPWLRDRLKRLETELSAINDRRKRLKHLIAVIWRDIPSEENSFANNIIQAVSGASSEEGYDPSLLKTAEKFVARMLREILPADRLEVVDVSSLSHVVFMAFDGFAMSAHVNPGALCGDKEIELLCNLILGDERRSTAADRKAKSLQLRPTKVRVASGQSRKSPSY